MQTLTTAEGLVLEPLRAKHAEAMFDVLSDPEIYTYLDYGPPPSVEHVRALYAQWEKRRSPDGTEQWLNWVVFVQAEPVGFVQATLQTDAAWIAYVLASRHWGRGHAHSATRAVIDHLSDVYGVTCFLAVVDGENARSVALLERLSFHRATPVEAARHELSGEESLFVR